MNQNNNCLFCKIIAGEIPAHKVYEDKEVLAFLDIKPVNPGHTLIVPKNHSRNILGISDGDMESLSKSLKKVTDAVKEGVGADGINIWVNNEPDAGQVIFHTHFHVIPRFKEDSLKLWPQKEYEEGEAEKIARKIKNNF